MSYTYHDPKKICPTCNGSGKLRVTENVKVDYRTYSSSHIDNCHDCDGTGQYTLKWLSRHDYDRMIELDKKLESMDNGTYVPPKGKKKSKTAYTIVGFIIGFFISGGNIFFGLFFAFLGLALSCK